jgi:hypothetical protein
VAQKIRVDLVCDVCEDEKPGSETLTFGLEGSNYEIDVCDQHAAELRGNLASFVGSGRRVSSGRGRGRRAAGGTADRQRTQEMRAWAKKQGIKVSERGRISSDVVQRYEAAHR